MSCLYEGGGAEGDGLLLEVYVSVFLCVCGGWGGFRRGLRDKPMTKKDAYAALKSKERRSRRNSKYQRLRLNLHILTNDWLHLKRPLSVDLQQQLRMKKINVCAASTSLSNLLPAASSLHSLLLLPVSRVNFHGTLVSLLECIHRYVRGGKKEESGACPQRLWVGVLHHLPSSFLSVHRLCLGVIYMKDDSWPK